MDINQQSCVELFQSQNFSERKLYIKELLNNGYGPLSEDSRDYFSLVINAHHRGHGATDFKSVKVVMNGCYSHNNFHCEFIRDGEYFNEKVGVGQTLSKSPDRDKLSVARAKCKSWLRNSLYDVISKKKSESLIADNHCAICGEEVSFKTAHIDHYGEYEFRHLANLYLDALDVAPGLLNIELKDGLSGAAYFADSSYTNVWVEYHNLHAKLQLTCQTCNLKKSKW